MSILFADTTHSEHMAKQHAELYMLIYQYAAEDFSSVTDTLNFAKDVIRWALSVETRLQGLGVRLQAHKHGNGNNGKPTTTPLSSLTWKRDTLPRVPLNTTGAISNIALNNFSSKVPLLGDLTFIHNRRSLVIPILLIPVIPPILKIGL